MAANLSRQETLAQFAKASCAQYEQALGAVLIQNHDIQEQQYYNRLLDVVRDQVHETQELQIRLVHGNARLNAHRLIGEHKESSLAQLLGMAE